MKKVIMSVIALAIALALVVAIWVPLAKKSRDSAQINYSRTKVIDSDVAGIADPVVSSVPTSSDDTE